MKGPDPPQRPASPRRSKTLPRLADAAPLSHRQMSNALSSAPSLPPPESSRSGTSTKRTKSKSPTRDGKSLNQVKSLDSYTIYDLEECIPSVRMIRFEEVEPKKLPPAVAKLYKTLEKVSTKIFPDELKEAFKKDSTNPRKPKPSPKANEFMTPNSTFFPPKRLPHLKDILDHVVHISKQDYRKNAHERDWGGISASLLREFEMWSTQEVRLLNVEDVSIELNEFRIRTRQGQILDWDEQSTSNSATTNNNTERSISRMIDWCVAIDLSDEELKVVQKGNSELPDMVKSLNQSTSWIRSWPIFLDVELKKTLTDRDPKVQLAIWACGGMLKRRWHHWSTNLPFPGITITGPKWEYFLFFEMDEDLIMIGPNDMGSTMDLRGVWQIAHRLQILIEWGKNDYRNWLETTVLDYFEDLSEQAEDCKISNHIS
ncbi:MAG: hypothetical protein Q9210_003748 [Variospora velana]